MPLGPEPKLVTKLPGPKAKAFLKRDDAVISTSYTRSYPFVMDYGEGMMARDVDGNVFLDFTAGIAVNATGHRHPKVMDAIRNAIDHHLIHMSGTDFYYTPQVAFAEALLKAYNSKTPQRVFFTNSGTESNEAAMKLSRWRTRRTNFISMRGAFHGRTFGSLSLGNSKAIHRSHFHPLLAGVHHMPYPDTYRGLKPGQTPEELAQECLDYLDNVIFRREVEPDQVAAIFVEPIQGEGGYVVPPKNFLPGIRERCTKHGIMMVCDEVQSGMGRSGKLFAFQHFGIEPDIVSLAKGIASGLPLGAIIAPKNIMEWPPGTHASTFGGNALACLAGIATLELLQESLIDNAAKTGKYLLEKLKSSVGEHKNVGDVRGIGLMVVADLVLDKKSKAHAAELRNRIEIEAFNRGLLLIGCGASGIRFCPSLIVGKDHCDVAVRIFKESLEAASKG